MKNIIFILFLAGIAILNYSCTTGNVPVKPRYTEVPNPRKPSKNHVWVDGSWTWDKRTRTYVRRDGYWISPNGKRAYVQGYWKDTHRGHKWVAGKWR